MKKLFRITHNIYALGLFTVMLAIAVYILNINFDWALLVSKLLNASIFTLVFVTFTRYWLNKDEDVDRKIYSDSIALAIYFAGFSIGIGLVISGGSIF